MDYDLTIIHKPGAYNIADFLPFECQSDASYSDSVHLARFNDKVAKYKSKLYTDKRASKQHSFHVGDIVLIN